MSTGNVNKSVLSSPSQTEGRKSGSRAGTSSDVLSYMKSEYDIEQSLKSSQKEAHQKRMQSLRKELDYLNSTAWQFERSDKNNGF